jgi:hypothetical protein
MAHESTAAAALVGLALWELARTYEEHAPKLGELRNGDRDSLEFRQRLLDADITVGGLALLVGGTASWLTRSWIPVVIVALGFAWISGLHHLVQGSYTPDQIP